MKFLRFAAFSLSLLTCYSIVPAAAEAGVVTFEITPNPSFSPSPLSLSISAINRYGLFEHALSFPTLVDELGLQSIRPLLRRRRKRHIALHQATHGEKRDVLGRGLELGLGLDLGGLLDDVLGTVSKALGLLSLEDKGWGVTVLRGTNDNHDIAWYTTMSVGTPPKDFRINIDTGSGDFLLYSSTCSTCPLSNHTSFSPYNSSTFSPSPAAKTTTFPPPGQTFNITYGDGSSAAGYYGSDTITLPSGLSVQDQRIDLAEKIGGLFGQSGYDGIAGVGSDSLSFVDGTRTLFSNLARGGKLKQNVLGVGLVKEDRKTRSGGGGEYIFGAIDRSYIEGDVEYVNVTSSSYWGVPLLGVYMGGKQLMGSTDPQRVIIDTGTSLSYFSTSLAKTINSQIPNSQRDPSTGIFYVPCNLSPATTPNIFFQFSTTGSRFGIPIEDIGFLGSGRDSQGRCMSGIQGGSPDFSVLGDIFIKNHYLVFDNADGSGNGRRVGFANRTDIPPIL